jgi:hypothetical protein
LWGGWIAARCIPLHEYWGKSGATNLLDFRSKRPAPPALRHGCRPPVRPIAVAVDRTDNDLTDGHAVLEWLDAHPTASLGALHRITHGNPPLRRVT